MRQDARHRSPAELPRAPVASAATQRAAAATGIDESQLESWASVGLVAIENDADLRLELHDAALVRSLCDEHAVGLRPAKLRQTLDRLRGWLPEPRQSLRDVTLVARGGNLLVRLDDGDLCDATGQRRFDFHDDAPLTLGRIGSPDAASPTIDWHERGVRHELDGNLVAAIACYERSLGERGPNAQTLFDLAHALGTLGLRERAIERYRQAVELDPTFADAWMNLGDLLASEEQFDAAIEAIRRALDLAPDDATAHYDLADVLDAAGQIAQARLHYDAFLRLADEPAAHVAYARAKLAAR